VDPFLQHTEPVDPGRIGAAYRRLAFVPVLQDLLGGDGRVGHADLLPVTVLVQETAGLHQSFRLGVDPSDIPKIGSWQSRQSMSDGKDGLSYDIILKLH